jgi:Ca2+-transporting ATPase
MARAARAGRAVRAGASVTRQTTAPASAPPAVAAPHALAAGAVAEALGVDPARGLSPDEVERRRARHGWNELPAPPEEPLFWRLLAQFRGPIVGTLLAAAAVSALLRQWTDALAVLAIVILNGVLGFFHEARAGRALAALRRLAVPAATAVRGGAAARLPARELVPGDLIALEAGDAVPADARLLRAVALRAQEAALTGESVPVEKEAEALLPEPTPLADRRNLALEGTTIVAGKASAIVTATGAATELGKIAAALGREAPVATPLERRLAELGRALLGVCLGAVLIVAAVQLARGGGLADVFVLGVSLAVVAIPEGLPAVVTVALALGLERMVRRNVLVRRLASVETLGSVTVICSDKTGTLTRNEMTVERVLAGRREIAVGGAGYAPAGELFEGGRPLDERARAAIGPFLAACVRCNHARLLDRGAGRGVEVEGDPTEGALLVLARKAGVGRDPTPHVLAEMPFDSARRAMSVVIEEPAGEATIYTKGAPEVVLAMCAGELVDGAALALGAERREELLDAAARLAAEGLRVLGLAFAPGRPLAGPHAEEGLSFLGLAAMRDPPREEARAAVARCHEAGIRPVMITGDHACTAQAIARELGIAGPADEAASGADLDVWSEDELAARVARIAVYGRVTAEHKLRIVHAWKRRGHTVAMTGDGVNDAPAVQAADIGIAMGRSGTDVTREAAAMVLTDDNFASIVNAVEEGRGIYDNIQKFVRYLLSCSVGAVLFLFAASVAGWPVPLFPVQLLWVNLVTNGLPALALALEPVEAGIMRRAPRPPGEPVIPRRMRAEILGAGVLLGLAPLAAFAAVYLRRPAELAVARTTAFSVLVYSQLFFSLAARSERLPLTRLGLGGNPVLFAAIAGSALLQLAAVHASFARRLFRTAEHGGGDWALVIGVSVVPFLAIEAGKWLWNYCGRFVRSN